MPNHVKNIVKMDGITKLPLFTEEESVMCFDFNKLIPMPESLNIESGSKTDESIVYYLTEKCTRSIRTVNEESKQIINKLVKNMFGGEEWPNEIFLRILDRTYSMSEMEKEKIYSDGKIYVDNWQNYGATTWYDWRCEKWDTKWNAYDNEQPDDDTIVFETAWSSPQKVIEKLAQMYPGAVIEHWWADEDMGSNTGYARYERGQQVEICWNDSCSNDAYDTYVTCWGDTDCLYKDEEGLWQRNDCETCHGCE